MMRRIVRERCSAEPGPMAAGDGPRISSAPRRKRCAASGNASNRSLNASCSNATLRLQIEQLHRIAAENIGLFGIAERCRREDVVHRMQLPWIRVIAADHDLAGT